MSTPTPFKIALSVLIECYVSNTCYCDDCEEVPDEDCAIEAPTPAATKRLAALLLAEVGRARQGGSRTLQDLRSLLRSAGLAASPNHVERHLVNRLERMSASVDGLVDFLAQLAALLESPDTSTLPDMSRWQSDTIGRNGVFGVFVRQTLAACESLLFCR